MKILKENLDKGHGVSDIFKKYVMSGNEKFVVFLKNTTHLRVMKPVIEKWFLDAGFNVRLYEVHCKNTDKDREFQAFTEDKEDGIIKLCLSDNLDAKNIGILLMFATGIRVGELVALKHDVFEGNTFKIRRTETRFLGENGRYVYDVKEFPKSEAGLRTVIIPKDYEWLCAKIRLLNPFGEYIFTDKNGKRLTTNCIRRRQERNCTKLGIYKKSPHKIRKTYGSILLDHNVDNRMIIEQMGHTDIACTENHYHRNRRSIDAKSQILSNIPELQVK